MTRQCAAPGCARDTGSTADVIFNYCRSHERALLSHAWHDDARACQLRPAVVGGVPLDQDPEKEAEVNGVVPLVAS